MADYKIKSNLNLYGNSINNFAIQADSGFPASPIMGRTQFYTGGGEYANHIVVYDGKSWKAVAYTDDVKNNADFINLKARVDAFLDGGVNSNDVLDNLREIQQFLDTYGDTTKLVDLLGEINEDIAEQADRISDLESKATQVSVSQTITAGKEIGKVTIDGNTTKLYAPANYNWNEIEGTPRTLDGYGILDGVMYKGVSGANASGASWMGYTYNTTEHGGAVAGGVIQAGGENNAFQLNGGYEGNALYYRGKNSGVFTDWRKIALADEVLPLSGGTISINSMDGFTIKRTDENAASVTFSNKNGLLGYFGIDGSKIPYVLVDGAKNAILHIGNYATYAAKTDGSNASGTWGIAISGSAASLTPYYVNNLDNALENRFFHSGFQAANRPATNYGTGFTISNSELGYLHQLAFDSDNYIYARRKKNDTWDAWKQLAYTDSDITGNAAGLKHSNGTIAAVVNSSGNVAIGSSDKAGADAKLHVDGQIKTLGHWGADLGVGDISTTENHWNGSKSSLLLCNNNNALSVLVSAKQNERKAIIQVGHSSTTYADSLGSLHLNPFGGNVLIGTNTDNGSGAKLQVAGGASISGGANIGGDIIGAKGLYIKQGMQCDNGTDGAYFGASKQAYDGSGGGVILAYGANSLKFVTNGSTRMTITGSGGVVSDGIFYAKQSAFFYGYNFYGDSKEGIAIYDGGIKWHSATYEVGTDSDLISFGSSVIKLHKSAIFDNGVTINNGKLYANAGADITGDVYVDGNVHITGNLFAEKELGGGGVGTPSTGGGTGGGSAASGLFAVKRISEGVQSITLNHGLDTRNLVICIYEKDENALTEQWNMCLTDVEIISEMEIRVSFGSATTTEHKVVIMGAA